MPIDPITAISLAGSAVDVIGGIFGRRKARRRERAQNKKAREAKREMNRLKQAYASISTSNPFLNMENVYEDLTVNQQAAQFEAQQFQQSQANILGNLRGAAGGSGIGALAQSLAQQGQLAAQRASADIASQENRLQQLRAGEASRIQGMERRGELESRRQQRAQVSDLYGLAAEERAAYRQNAAAAKKQRQEFGAQIAGGVMGGLTTAADAGVFDGLFGGGGADLGGSYAPIGQAQTSTGVNYSDIIW